jgi:hypothetical protein
MQKETWGWGLPVSRGDAEYAALASPATNFSREAAKFAKENIANTKPSRLRVFA